jgi:effector-binding domain-containing protein
MLRQLLTYLEGAGQQSIGPPYARLLSFEAEEAEIEAGVPVDQPIPGEGPIEAGELPGGSVASTVHLGPYNGLGAVHEEITRWMSERGLRASGSPWEVYESPPDEEPARTRTEVCWPLADDS